MAVAEANALATLMAKAKAFSDQIAMDWYKTSQAMDLFPVKIASLNQASNHWTSLVDRYGISADQYIVPVLESANQLLAKEQDRVRKLQQNRCRRVGRRLLFPVSIIGALDSVITAFQTLSDGISQQAKRTEDIEKASWYRAAPLLLSHDRKYVPFEASITAVRKALESESPSPVVVVVCGGPGQGKSSMAKHLACLYQDGIDPVDTTQGAQGQTQGSVIAPDSKRFVYRFLACLYQDGIDPLDTTQGAQGQTQGIVIAPGSKRFVDRVLFLWCGENANCKRLLMQLWQDLGYQALSTSASQGDASSSNEMSFALLSEHALLQQLSARLANQKLLIVLDDVWDRMIVQGLLVRHQGIKYLITTQCPRLWADAVEIPISLPNFQEANQIIAKHVKGFPKNVPSGIQDQINQIIAKSASNPLVLANVATSIGEGNASHLQKWVSTVRYLPHLQNGNDQRPVTLFGHIYSKRTMGASLQLTLSSFSDEAKSLLLLACVFESQPVPEVVFKTFFKITYSNLAKFSTCYEDLETINFIQIESPTDLRSDSPPRSWSLHTMWQSLISLIKKKEIDSTFSKLMAYTTNDNLVAILIVLYGQESWRNKAASKLGISVNQFVNDTYNLGSSALASIKTFVWLLNPDGEEEWQKKSHQVTKQILEDYLILGELKQKNIIELLSMQETVSGACQALLELTILNQKPLFMEILPALMTVLQKIDKDSQPHLKELLRLLGHLAKRRVQNASKIGSFPGAVERLVGLLGEGVTPDVQKQAAWALGCLSKDVVQNATNIGSFPGAMERLVGLLGEEVSPGLQMQGAKALWFICCAVVENKNHLRRALLGAPRALESLRVLTCNEKHQEMHLQYWSAHVYEMVRNENEEKERVYLSTRAYEGKGDALLSMGDYKGALEAYDNALAIEMVCALVSKRCYVKAMLEDFEGALTDANEYIELGGDRPFGLQERGVVKRMMGDLLGALADLNEGLELETDNYESLKQRGRVKFLLMDEDGARADAEWALRIKPSRVESYRYGRSPVLGTIAVEYLGYKVK